MSKLKTHKNVASRIKITKNGKMFIRKGGQDHFNARESGKVTIAKRRNHRLAKTEENTIKKLLPYS
ncbi:MAG: 50S ribosomal protein L35 [Patescibacteria group bacterium]